MSETERHINSFVKSQIGIANSLSLAYIKELITPYCEFDYEAMKEKELDRLARRAIMSIKDENGIRTFFADSNGNFINVDINTSLDSMQDVREQLVKKQTGLNASVVKIDKRIVFLSDQLNLFDMQTDSAKPEISVEADEPLN